MADHTNVEAKRWVHVFVESIFILRLLNGAKKSLSLGHGGALVHLSFALFFLSNETLVLAECTVEHDDVTLSNLEEVLIWLVWAEFSIEGKVSLRCDSLALRSDFEWVADPLLRNFVIYLEEGPVNFYGKWEFVLNIDWFRFADTTHMSKVEV